MAADWMDSAPQEMSIIHFSKNPASINVDDYLVYYATGYIKLFGIVQIFNKPQFDAQAGSWPYWCQIRPKLMIHDFDRAPDLSVLNVEGGKDFHKTEMQMDYSVLEDAQYQRALSALLAAVDTSQRDFLDEGFGTPMPDEETPKIIYWPYPDPGPGMSEETRAEPWRYPGHEPSLTSDAQLTPADIPGPNAGWAEIGWFALRMNGYQELGNDEVADLANNAVQYHREHGQIDPGLTLTQLRGCLFFEQRRFRHYSHDPTDKDVPYIRTLVEAIRAQIPIRASSAPADGGESPVEQLKRLGVRGILLQLARDGQIVDVSCEMPQCYCFRGR